VKDVEAEIVYLAAAQVLGEVLHVDNSVHFGKW
jgi:hypothetical protein